MFFVGLVIMGIYEYRSARFKALCDLSGSSRQFWTHFTSARARCITAAVDIRVKKTHNDTKRTPNATVWQGHQYGRIDLSGKIMLTGFRKDAVEVEVTRNVLGDVDSADSNGKTEMVNIFEDPTFAGTTGPYPYWWGWFSWPWWCHLNGVGRITWTVTLEPKKPLELGHTWNYYWR